MDTSKGFDINREMQFVKFETYSRIVARKHGIAVRFTRDDIQSWSDEQIATYVEALKDLAHLPAT